MSDEREIWYPVTTYHVDIDTATIPPNEKLGSPQMPALQVTLWTTATPTPIQLMIPVDTARNLQASLGAAFLRL